MSEDRLVRGIVLAHGTMAGGIVDAVARISGVAGGALISVSNDGKSPEALESELEAFLGKGPVVFFTDLPSGSCAVAARICCQQDSDAAVISGVNLPVLLDFVFHRELPLEELLPRLVRKGREGLKSVPDFSEDGAS
jgi:mannose/fructose-specific phosphotransferase system component IIA